MLPDKKNGFCFFEIDWLKLASIHCIQGYQFKWRGFSDEILTHLEILRHETRSLITPLHLTKMHAQYITFYTLHCSQLQSFYITGLAVKKVIFHSYRNATIKLEGICLEQLQFNFPLLDIKYCILIFWTKNCYHILFFAWYIFDYCDLHSRTYRKVLVSTFIRFLKISHAYNNLVGYVY